jgi:phage N-6-adenine-methyltransferase
VSLVRFSARNHPQQTSRAGARPEVDDRATDPVFFASMALQFGGFTLDVAASPHNAKCDRFYTAEEDGLEQSWYHERVWCNPPYSAIEPWVQKAWAESAYAHLIVMLLPANRTEQGWWQRLVEPERDLSPRFRTRFLPGRIRFIAHDKTSIGPNERPPFGCVLLVWTRGESTLCLSNLDRREHNTDECGEVDCLSLQGVTPEDIAWQRKRNGRLTREPDGERAP